MDIRNLHKEVSHRLDKLNFSAFWRGFKRYPFALYTSKTVILENDEFPWDTRFRGNTSIEYGGGFIAIWNVEADFDFLSDMASSVDSLAASLVHEMFHAYQFECGETRFPRDLDILLYPWDAENYALKNKENAILAKAFMSSAISEKRTHLTEFCALRTEREKLHKAMLELEYLSETAEGMAEYVGALALKALSPKEYSIRMEEYCEKLLKPDEMLFNIRRISYFSGAVLLIAANEAGLDFYHELSGENAPVYSFVKAKLTLAPPLSKDCEKAQIAQSMIEAKTKREAEIAQFEANAKAPIPCRGYICGYDPMNMTRIGDKLFCKTFVMIKTADDTVTLEGKSLLYMESSSAGQVEAYTVAKSN